MQALEALDNPAWRDSDKRLGWLTSQRNPFDRACASRRCFALSTNPSARPLCAPKETIMLYELRSHFARWLAYRRTLASLRRAPDSTLADAGISREEIRERARHASLRL
ncbi:DUF1127 domain-containing protein [Mesorhizobium sp. M0047]|uniref:DUF1127 domain-containing protein n=1 Tax=Mesorhizobium sp. M0047 TaxID=2956859 RepID=UPI003339B51B